VSRGLEVKQPFAVHIGDVRLGRSEPRRFEVEIPVTWHLELSRVLPDPPLHVDVELAAVVGGFTVIGTVAARVVHRCFRCLTEWDELVVRDVAQLVTIGGEPEDDYRADGEVYDLEDLVRDELLLAMPLAPMCRPDCEGLVVAAGSDLNTNLSEDERAATSPFSVLKDLLDTGD
jgi:uncharacterized protein